LKQLIHYILVFVVMVERILRGTKIKIVNKEQLNKVKTIKGPIIFSPTHCGKFDIQTLTEVLWQYRWSLLSGDPMWLPGTVEGYWLQFHGVIYVDRDNKAWREHSKNKMVAHLKKGENIMMYPEGTWNLSPNLPMLPLFRGIADIAKETNAIIIPFAQEIDDKNKTYYVKIGEPIYPNAEPLEVLDDLRNQMAEMKWSLVEELPFCKADYNTQRAKEILRKGENLTIAPEGVWNVSGNLLVLPLYSGAIKIAMETGCDIVPVGVAQNGKDFVINIGENFKVTTNENLKTPEEIKLFEESKKEDLRNTLATLKWEIIEQGSVLKRDSLGDYETEYKKYVSEILDEWKNPKTKENYYSEELVKQRTFKPKNIITHEMAFEHLENLKPNKNNAFLFDKRLI